MRLKELDTQLATLQTQLQFATENIIELSELPLCKQLRADLDAEPNKLAGLTRDCVCAALAEIDQTLQWILLVKPTLERAVTVRQSLWMTQETKIHELEQLLSGPAVALPPVETPLLGRSLTGPAESPQYASIGDLQSRMAKNFDSAKRTILALQAALELNPRRLTRLNEELTALDAIACDLQVSNLPWAKSLRENCAELQRWLDSDPLHVSETLTLENEPALKAARKELRELREELDRAVRNVARAQSLVEELEALQARAAALHAESSATIHHCAALRAPLSAARLNELRDWLSTLQRRMPTEWQHARAALHKWTTEVERALATERVTIAINARPLELYAELRGRFEALRAKARGISSSEVLQKIGSAAEQTLKTRPIQLELGAKLVHAYEKTMSAASLIARTPKPGQPARQRK